MKNKYTHLIILDFEATCDEKDPPKPQEIIEFPSVLLSLNSYQIVDEFQAFVRPVHNPQLTDFCKTLTSIQQSDLDQAKIFSDVLLDHIKWLESHGLDETNSLIVTCGDWDMANMFPAQCLVSQVEDLSPVYTSWMNIKKPYCKVMETQKAAGMAGMLRQLGLKLIGHHHRGIDDCRNIAEIAKVLLKKGAEASITGTLALNKYPPLTLNLTLGEKTETAVLKIRNISSLYGLIGKVFKCRVTKLKLSDGKVIESDEGLRYLNSGQEIVLST